MMRLKLFSIAFAVALMGAGAYAQPEDGPPEGREGPPRREGREGGPREGRRGPPREDGEGPREGRPEGGPRFPAPPLMAALDADGNGELSAEEIEGAVAALKKLDKNSDGVLTREELRPDFGGREGGFGGREGGFRGRGEGGFRGRGEGFGGREGGPEGRRGRRPPADDEGGEEGGREGRRPRPEGEDGPPPRRPDA